MHTEHANLNFELNIESLSQWDKKAHKHSFFELVYIKEGNGRQCINQSHIDYKKGNIFLLPPLDCHSFEIESSTTFVFLKFSNQYFNTNNSYEINTKQWFERISFILRNYNKTVGNFFQNKTDNQKIVQLIELIITEHQRRDKHSNIIIQNLIIVILNILARHIEFHMSNIVDSDNNKAILIYIQNHLFTNKKLKISELASKFNISKSYFSEYFQNNFGQSLSKYILNSRLKVVETRLLYSNSSIKEIAHEVGFTDSSHLSNVFKKNYGITIGQFKINGEYKLLKETNCTI